MRASSAHCCSTTTARRKLHNGSVGAADLHLCLGETVGAMGVRVRSGTIRTDTASRLLATFAREITRWNWSETIAADISNATDYILELTRPLRFADAVHIATARRLNTTLISTDRQQLVAAAELGAAVFNPLEQSQ